MNNAAQTYSRGQLDRLTGVKGETIRYYENCGLLPAPPRSAGGHRLYNEEHKKRLILALSQSWWTQPAELYWIIQSTSYRIINDQL